MEYSFGMNVKDNCTPLKIIEVKELIEIITSGTRDIANTTHNLRKVIKYSKEHYRNMKTQLPFVSCSIFEQNIRKYEHFISANGWIIDIDSDVTLDKDLRHRIVSDSRVFIAFTSPNGMGLKLFFKFIKPYADKVNYKSAYKAFTQEFALKYGLMSQIDFKNCDVSRVCFICYDKDCHYNEEAEKIDPEIFVHKIVLTSSVQLEEEDKNEKSSIDEKTYRNILHRLGTAPRSIQSKPMVPYEVIKVIEPITIKLREYEIEVVETEPVQCGMKIMGRSGNDKAEVIIYYGKQGY
ncbi:MAG: hypothetical protein RLZZ546_258, partial [Bacteroidota bacterium]